ncbi:MAG: ABC transporter ATP-binding protein, partial [Steroidobacteraceae bacterium]
MSDPILLASHLFFSYDESTSSKPILQDVSIAIAPGSIVAIVGESGSGKSTLAKLLCGMLKPTQGEILYRGEPLRAPAMTGLHLLSQEPYSTFNPYHDVRRLLCEPLQAQGQLPSSSQTVAHLLQSALVEVGLGHIPLDASPRSLSGGQLQRLALARILLLKPQVIIGDEPFSALDVSIRAQILELMLRLREERGLTYVLISHDIDLVERTADQVAVIHRGRIVESGAAKEVIAQPAHPYTLELRSASPIRRLHRSSIRPGQARQATRTRALEICDLQLSHTAENSDRVLVDGVDLTLERGDTLAIVGESGAGKSLTARAVIGLLPPAIRVSRGRIAIGETSIIEADARSLRQLRGSAVSYIPQDPLRALNPVRRIGDLFNELLSRHGVTSARERRDRIARSLRRVALSTEVGRRFAHELSGGMRQRAFIAMAIAVDPLLIIADEPTTALDATVQAEILDLLRDLTDGSTALLLITHDLAVAANLCRRILVMRQGKIVEQGVFDQILTSPTADYTRQLILSSLLEAPRS